MSSLRTWDTDAANNNSPSPDGFPAGMNYQGVDNSSREVMASIARNYKDENGSLVATGVANTYAITLNETSYAAYAVGDTFSFTIPANSTGASTLNVTPSGGSALGAKALVHQDGAAMRKYDLRTTSIITVVYNGTSFVVVSGATEYKGVGTQSIAYNGGVADDYDIQLPGSADPGLVGNVEVHWWLNNDRADAAGSFVVNFSSTGHASKVTEITNYTFLADAVTFVVGAFEGLSTTVANSGKANGFRATIKNNSTDNAAYTLHYSWERKPFLAT